jgi:hypothetical protein
MVRFQHQFCNAMNFTPPLTFALAALVVACAPIQPAPHQVIFRDAMTGCRYAMLDGHRFDFERCDRRGRP